MTWPTTYTDRPWWTVEDAARLLRVNRKTLYEACAAGDFPCDRVGRYVRIPAEALRLTPRTQTRSRTYHVSDDSAQLMLPLDVFCLVPVKRFRNTREIVEAFHYEHDLYATKARRTPQDAA